MRTSNPLPQEDLSFVADALLALCERSPGRPFYTHDGLMTKIRQAERHEAQLGDLLQRQGSNPLLKVECNDVFSMARLTAKQSDVLTKRLEGWTFEEIGHNCRHSKQAAQHIFVQALKKIARAFRVYAYKGLSEVYHEETHRGLRRAGLGRIPQSAI